MIASRDRPRQRTLTWLALAWLVLVFVISATAPWLAGDPQAIAPVQRLHPPHLAHPLGTDWLGRDMLTRLLWGARLTLGSGAVALLLAIALGLSTATLASITPGIVKALFLRLIDALLSIPSLLLAMASVAIIGPSPAAIILAVALSATPAYARFAYSIIRQISLQPYVDAARALGCPRWRLLTHHILPNAAGPLIAHGATQLGWIVLNTAALNFLSLGTPPGSPEWGAMLNEGRSYIRDAPWTTLFPGLALTLTVLATHVLGDTVQETWVE